MLIANKITEGSVVSMKTRICPETGQEMTRGVKLITLKYEGFSEEVEMPGWYTADKEHGIHNSDDMKVSNRALMRMKAKASKLLQPEQIKTIRKKLNLTQTKAGEYIGGGPKAFQKYEAGTLLPSKAISNLLIVLDNYPEAINLMKKEEEKPIIETAAM